MTAPADSTVLRRDAIFLGRASESMSDAIEFVGRELVDRGIVGERYIDGMRRREETVSTFLGNGVALPHGTFETKGEVKGTAIVIAQYPDGITWGGDEVHLVIGLAAEGDDHVQVLSQLAEILQDEETCRRLWTTDDADYVYETLTAVSDDEDYVSTTVTILNPAGLHARPAALIVERAKAHTAEVTITKGARTADAKSIMSVLTLGAVPGDSVQVSAHGPDAEQAVAEVVDIMTSTEEQP